MYDFNHENYEFYLWILPPSTGFIFSFLLTMGVIRHCMYVYHLSCIKPKKHTLFSLFRHSHGSQPQFCVPGGESSSKHLPSAEQEEVCGTRHVHWLMMLRVRQWYIVFTLAPTLAGVHQRTLIWTLEPILPHTAFSLKVGALNIHVQYRLKYYSTCY